MAKAWTFGENMNTDEIIPGRYNITIDPLELAKNVFCEVKPEYAKTAQPATSSSAGKILAAVLRANMRQLPSKVRRPNVSSRHPLRESFLAMPSTSACQFWNVPKRLQTSPKAMTLMLIFRAEKFSIAPMAITIKRKPCLISF
jgi:hypothetical protein